MLVNREGDLEVYAVHDTPKHSMWSSRGSLAIGAGQSYRVIPGFDPAAEEDMDEPWDTPLSPTTATANRHQHHKANSLSSQHPQKPSSRSRSVQGLEEHDSLPHESSLVRGRVRGIGVGVVPPAPATIPVLFGRGDEDGFPALAVTSTTAQQQTNLAATRPGRSRTFSPASLRHLGGPVGRSGGSRSASRSRGKAKGVWIGGKGEGAENGGEGDVRGMNQRNGETKRRPSGGEHVSAKKKERGKDGVVERVVMEDISMVMRRRAVRGYGIGYVLLSLSVLIAGN